MSRRPSNKKDLMLRAVTEFPSLSKRALATYLHNTYPTVFVSVELARTYIKSYTSPSSEITEENKFEYGKSFKDRNPFGIAESKGSKRKFIYLPEAIKNVLILSDIHFPNHDKEALEAALQYGLDNKIDCIVLNGDILDNEPFTSHLAPPPLLSDVREWFDMVEGFLDMLIRVFKVPIYWLEGNHDAWYRRYLMKSAPLLFHDSYYTMPARLKLREKGIEWLPEDNILMVGKLPVTHGHLIVKGFFSPVNPAKGVYNKINSSMLIGHCHTTSEHSGSTLDHQLITCYSIGCLCTLAPGYDPFCTKHNLGFAYVEVKQGGNYRVHNKRIDYYTKEIY
jgi:predicted phosphodiesterase